MEIVSIGSILFQPSTIAIRKLYIQVCENLKMNSALLSRFGGMLFSKWLDKSSLTCNISPCPPPLPSRSDIHPSGPTGRKQRQAHRRAHSSHYHIFLRFGHFLLERMVGERGDNTTGDPTATSDSVVIVSETLSQRLRRQLSQLSSSFSSTQDIPENMFRRYVEYARLGLSALWNMIHRFIIHSNIRTHVHPKLSKSAAKVVG